MDKQEKTMSKYPVEEKYGIKVEEVILSGNPDWDSWMTVYDSEGTHLVHYIGDPNEVEPEEAEEPAKRNGRPTIKLPEDRIKELHKQGLGYKAIATQLKREGYKTSFMTVKRILART